MRALSMKQRKAIDKIMNNRDVSNIDDITKEEFDDIFIMNPHETFYLNFESYMFNWYNR